MPPPLRQERAVLLLLSVTTAATAAVVSLQSAAVDQQRGSSAFHQHGLHCRPVYTWWEPTRPPISLNISNSTLREVAAGISDIVMLGWVTDNTCDLHFTQGGPVPQSKALWSSQRSLLQTMGFRVHAYIELNPGGTSHCAANASAAAAFGASVGSLMEEGWDGLQVSVEGCGPNEKHLIPQYQQFVAGLKQKVGAQRELGVWIHEYCNEPSDFCMTCNDYKQTPGFDRVIYYGPQYWGYISAAQIDLIGQAQAALGKAGTPGMAPKALRGNLFGPAFGRPEHNATLLRSLDAVAFQGWPLGTGANSTVVPTPLSNYRALPCE